MHEPKMDAIDDIRISMKPLQDRVVAKADQVVGLLPLKKELEPRLQALKANDAAIRKLVADSTAYTSAEIGAEVLLDKDDNLDGLREVLLELREALEEHERIADEIIAKSR